MVLSPSKLTLTASFDISYTERGPRTGRALVFVPGYSDSWRSYLPVLASLPDNVRAVAVSQRGHGDSSRPYTGYSPRDFAADLGTVLDKLHIQEAIIVGHSLGSVVAQRFALDFPHRTLGVVLIGAFGSTHCHPTIEELWNTSVAHLEDPVDPEFVEDFQRSTLAQFVPAPFFDSVVEESLKMPARVWKASLAALGATDLSREISRIKQPVWIAWGDRDTTTPYGDQDLLMNLLPNARLSIYEGAGHALHWEKPHRFALDLMQFVTEIA